MKKETDLIGEKTRNGGKRPGSGRKPGSPNKVTADVRQMLLTALEKGGGVDYLLKQMEENPTSFNSLISKIIPKEIAMKVDVVTAINTEINFGD